jgi:hypothetical protein
LEVLGMGMKGAWMRLALLCGALVAAMIGVSGGSAGPRVAEVTFKAFPGPAKVSYDEQIAYRATFKNISGTTLTKVIFRQRYPVADGAYAEPVKSTCPSTPTTITTPTGPEWICNFGNQSASAPPLTLIVVWQLPPLPATSNCPDCLVTNGRWTVKEATNDVSDPNDAIPPEGITVFATLLASNEGGEETLEAGGFETEGVTCADTTSHGNLETNPVVSLTNPVTSTVCLPPFTTFGHAVTITETLGNPRHSDVCVAALDTDCGPTYIDATFGAPYVTHIFHVADAALPKNYKIRAISHNGNPALEEGECSSPSECVLLIHLDHQTGIWTLIATSDSNGYFDW